MFLLPKENAEQFNLVVTFQKFKAHPRNNALIRHKPSAALGGSDLAGLFLLCTDPATGLLLLQP